MATLPTNVHVFDHGEAFARAAAAVFREILVNATGDRISVCLSGGSTPKQPYELLLGQENGRRILWDRIHWFWGDERFVPMRDERSNAGMAWRVLLAHAPKLLKVVHVMPLSSNTAEHSAALYKEELKHFYSADQLDPNRPLFDLVLGLGEHGHTASLFPGSPALGERERCVTSVDQAGQAPFVARVTLTLPAFESACEVLFLVSGAAMRKALAHVLAGRDLPAGRVRPTGRLRWLANRAAAPEDEA